MKINPQGVEIQNRDVQTLFRSLERSELKLDDAEIFLDFPMYKGDDDNLVISQILMVSPYYGVIVFYSSSANEYNIPQLNRDDKSLERVAGFVVSRLIKNDQLRKGMLGFALPVNSLLFVPLLNSNDKSIENLRNPVVTTEKQLLDTIASYESNFPERLFFESISTIQGAKGLLKPEDRNAESLPPDSKAARITQVESNILMFDRDQQEGYIPALDGPQRIRGLAGSGKTVILAMKVAQTLLRDETGKATILYTFTTKSLYQHVLRLIQRFYREFHDDSTNLDRVTVMHSWGGRSNAGVYYEACKAFGHDFLTFPDAQVESRGTLDPFEYACKELLNNAQITPLYDYVFVDEAQDYGIYFMRLCTKLAKNKQVCFGADVFQNIFQKRTPTATEIFDDGTEFIKDKFLEVCYRTPLAILVTAHAIGLGVYGKQVQKIESVQYWNDLGYSVTSRQSGEFQESEKVEVLRESKNSPSFAQQDTRELLAFNFSHKDLDEEINSLVAAIENDIRGEGLLPEDIMVICADDYNCRNYFNKVTRVLNSREIYTNNVHAEKISIHDFKVKDRVTLTTIHKAKGNEAYSVYIVGSDFLCHNLNIRNRNLLFTAMTRTKGWLSVSGIGDVTSGLKNEMEQSVNNIPYIRFDYPTKEEAQQIEHDITHVKQVSSKDISELEFMLSKFGSFENMQKFMEEQSAKKGRK
ncbi:DEAD/DEAH box helicase [Kosakonia sp. CFBP8986]|uniref:DEAD/DEAH box helicase n=1 Tax=Kosakonia TaxID=1330547 RepID=UPI002A6A6A12|nr:ATP-binding domain-containing protein [Kosakonia sp. CFBP8986]MDY0888904.1 ATP-binding domain-containing protein [Kosakonia sp. CFBP8986]